MPDGVFSTEIVRGRFVGAKGRGITKNIDYADGGIALQDASRGLQYQVWRARLVDSETSSSRVLLSAPNTPEFILYSVPDMSEISVAFDQNMRPALAYVTPVGSFLWWYNSAIQGMEVTVINGETPRIVMDDTRLVATNGYQTNDIILAYKRGEKVYTRIQRQRFGEELDPTESMPEPQRSETRAFIAAQGGIIKIGMNRQLRLQFMMEIE